MMRGIWMTAAAVLALTGCDDRRQRVEQAITAGLKDPESARFGKDMKLYGPPDKLLACGTINARNAFGGYVGESPFMIWNGYVFLGTEETGAAIAECCDRVFAESKSGAETMSNSTLAVCDKRGAGASIQL